MKKLILSLLLLTITLTAFSQRDFMVMSFNIRNSNADDGKNSWKYRCEATAQMLKQAMPDIVGMQEVCPDQQDFLVKAMPDYGHIGVGRDDGKTKGEIMSVFYNQETVELVEWGTFWLSESPNTPSIGWDAACRRTCTWALMTMKKTGKKFLFYNTHLDHVGKVAREMEVRQIADSIKVMSKRLGITEVFLTGDFNTSATNPIFKPLKDALQEAREVSPVTDKGYTYNGFGKVNPDLQSQQLDSNGNSDNETAIDHIFFTGAEVTAFHVIRDNFGVMFVSDHFPVISLFR